MDHRVLNDFRLPLPVDDIYRRLGRNSHFASEPRPENVEAVIAEAGAMLSFHGAWKALTIAANDGETVEFEHGTRITDPGTAAKLADCGAALFLAASVGGEIVRARDEAMAAGDGFRAVILDAVGGECADAAADFTEKDAVRELGRRGLAKKGYRFSPGYGTLELQHQQLWFDLLPLAEWGVRLNEAFLMTPEKTVTALAGMKRREKSS